VRHVPPRGVVPRARLAAERALFKRHGQRLFTGEEHVSVVQALVTEHVLEYQQLVKEFASAA
jgi:hypothetical protein